MKDMDAMTLAVVRDRMRSGRKPPRDIVLAFLADEEAGGTYGARYLVDNHPGPLRGRHGGDQRGRRLLLHGQRGPAALSDRDGREGHALDEADRRRHRRARVDDPQRQRHHRAVRGGRPARPSQVPGAGHQDRTAFLDELSDALGTPLDPEDMEATLAELGGIAKIIGATLRNTANPTHAERRLQGQRHPGPGHRPRRRPLPARARGGVPRRPRPDPRPERVRREDVHSDKALETTFDGPLVDAMQSALLGRGPDRAKAVPYMLSGGTDAKSFDDLGSAASASHRSSCRRSWTSPGMFHGVDERVPVDGLKFGVRVLDRFIDAQLTGRSTSVATPNRLRCAVPD
jgi:acetylornithine deacetylase/succinyl-diaminopimelate desuccinylase-like protein